jgi:hypothetical protein
MSAGHDGGLRLTTRQYRWLDWGTKCLGLALITAGLEVGGDTLTGIVLAITGVAVGLTTVIIDTQ